MSFHAYKNKERTELIYAVDCTINDVGVRFYCENPECDAHLYIKALRSELSTHFSATNNHPHSSSCSTIPPFSFVNHSEELFNYDDVINNILCATNSVSKKSNYKHNKSTESKIYKTSISKLGSLFNACKNIKHTGTYNEYPIWKILFDCRCNYILTKGISGKHIVECSFYRYDNNFIYFKYPTINTLPNQYILKLNFPNKVLYNEILKKVFNTYKSLPIAIAGDWKREYGNLYYSDFQSGKQIYFPKSQIYKAIKLNKKSE